MGRREPTVSEVWAAEQERLDPVLQFWRAHHTPKPWHLPPVGWERIVTENNLDRKSTYGEKIVQDLAQSIGVSKRTVDYARQFYEKYPDLALLPGGKNMSWNKVIKLLPEPPKPKTPPLPFGQGPAVRQAGPMGSVLWRMSCAEERGAACAGINR